MHKALKEGEIAPVRPIVICNRTVMENPRKLVTFHLKEVSTVHPTYIKNTPDFIRKVENVNNNMNIGKGAVLVTLDVKALYTNILKEEGLQRAREALEERLNKAFPTEYLIQILEILLENNVFELNEEIYR